MARDPPMLGSSELRDIPLQPSSVHSARVSIIHPQLRDLILPLARGNVLHPRGTFIEQAEWDEVDAVDNRCKTRTIAKLTFTPTCLTACNNILACGGQKGELYMCDIETDRFSPPVTPFSLSMTLPSRSINNAVAILSSWPNGWHQRQARKGYHAEVPNAGEDDDESDDDMEIDEDVHSPASSSSVATYPNTVPFIHAPRIAVPPEPPRWSQTHNVSSHAPRPEEPRILVSNNDQTVKMFSLRRAFHTDSPPHLHRSPPLPPPRALFGSTLGYDSIGLNEGILNMTHESPETAALARQLRRVDDRDERMRQRVQNHLDHREEFEWRLGMQSDDDEREERKLSKVGGTKFKLAVNHSSLSPDLRTMVTVGDSTDVFLYEVIEGGREFRKIGVYSAATDYGFSTAWSKDGRKFAVASQDGQVTVWDHRSSRPLAIFYSSNATFSSGFDLGRFNNNVDYDHHLMLVDPVTGDPRLGSSTSGREAARVVKFSPEGSSRDLLVFSEENTNIHIIDAKTFHTHVRIPVPWTPPNAEPVTRRTGGDGSTWGIAGVAFDPTGDWLYSGTERTIVEWDLRRYGGGEGGTWAMN